MANLLRWLVPLLLPAAFVCGFWAGAWSISRDIRRHARQDLEIALRLSAPNADFERLKRRFRIPPALTDRDDATLYYLLAAREVEEGRDTGANYFLALYFLTRDCSLAKHYLDEQIRINGADERVTELRKRVEQRECAAAEPRSPLARL
jgi:hypothetical protein